MSLPDASRPAPPDVVPAVPASVEPHTPPTVVAREGSTVVQPTTVESPRRPWRGALLYLVALAALLLLRGWTATPWADVPVRNMDENLMYQVSMSIWTGAPGSILGWPGGLTRLATWISIPLLFVLENRHQLSADAFVAFLGHELREPWRMIVVLRWWTIVASSLGFAFLPLVLLRFTRSWPIAFAFGLGAACSGTIWVRSLMCTGDAAAWGFVAFGMWLALKARESRFNWSRWAIAAAIVAGLAIGSRTTAVFAWPLIFVASIRSWRTFGQTVLIWLILPALGFYLLSPYVFTDPIRFLKHTVGNLLIRPPSVPWPTSLRIAVPIPWLVAAAIAIPFALVRRRDAWVVIATLWCCAMFAVTIRSTRMIEPHYLAPLMFPVTVLAAILAERLSGRLSTPDSARRFILPAVAVVALGLCVYQGVEATRRASIEAAARYGPGLNAARYIEARHPTGRIALYSPFAGTFLTKLETDASIARRLHLRERARENGDGVVPFLKQSGLSERVARGLADQFNDTDGIAISNSRPQAQTGKTTGLTLLALRPYADFLATRQGFDVTVDEAVAQLRAGTLDGLLVGQPIEGLTITRDFGTVESERTLLYARPGSPLADDASPPAFPGKTSTTRP